MHHLPSPRNLRNMMLTTPSSGSAVAADRARCRTVWWRSPLLILILWVCPTTTGSPSSVPCLMRCSHSRRPSNHRVGLISCPSVTYAKRDCDVSRHQVTV